MASPVICIRDSAIKNGSLMVKDLFPNRSLANPVIDPAPQGPRYLRVVETATPSVANNAISKAVSGLSAYLIATVDVQAGGANPSPAQADLMANAIIARMRAGNAMNLAGINAAIQGADAAVNATGIVGTGASTATVNNILDILAGAKFTLPATTSVNNSYLTADQQASKFDSSVFKSVDIDDSSFYISVAKGDLSKMKSSRVVNGVTLDPYVVVYDETGAVL